MTIDEILNKTDHRPWRIPKGNWKFYQEWNNAVFLHWQVDVNELRKLVPPELEIDLFEGEAYVSIVAFTMEKIRPKYLPSFPPISDFDEINIRTYVKSNNKTGVYFLSIEGGTSLSCTLAKSLSELPYRFSKMQRETNRFHSENKEYGDRLDIGYKIGKEIKEKSKLELWLTERYALFQDTQTRINEFKIHHVEWPINKLELTNFVFNYPRFKSLFNGTPDTLGYSKGVQVIAWGKYKTQRIK